MGHIVACRPSTPKDDSGTLWICARNEAFVTTGSREAGTAEGEQGEVELEKMEAKNFRGVVARANYMAADCPNVQFATKEVCRDMALPTTTSQQKMKKLARYLLSWDEVTFQ